MIPAEQILAFITASVLLALAPGPDNLFVVTQSALYGARKGVLITLGLCTGLIFHTGLVASGIAVIFQTSQLAFTLLKTAGAAYLLYLAWQALRSSAEPGQTTDRGHAAAHQTDAPAAFALYRRGILMNITNPKVSLFFLALLPQFTVPANGHPGLQMMMLGGIFILVSLVLFSLFSLFAAAVKNRLFASPRHSLWLQRIAGGVFIAMALRLLITERS
ncbi:MAG: threonine transporter RhtB [Oceanospirillaceae bacterium]|uniref:LysE family translocator n=1 Tax=unclassified Thalassolituus TaxID=2624967 RepID=UPI000C368D2A|nr:MULTISPECIES: LysE family translocator [unclassified Thalassolituus]MAS25306.1 threonine transporter RhtB [Oceanospirillaceae bacterium]MBL33283.1 threonine transporter RhtB [Oceanospirillaceae bacterium]MBS54361.1 threonine transporter RhtB [Oceanospirillaceae bacterium]